VSLRFGTDGVRGVANVDLTPELVLALGRAAARVLPGKRFLIGRDPRQSGPMLESAFVAGLASEGVNVERLGVLPTPAVAWLSAVEDVPAAMVSASHNPFADNGVKLFAAGGKKLPDDVEEELEAELDRLVHGGAVPPAGDVGVGSVVDRAIGDDYERFLLATIEGDLAGMRVVVDCANGAASHVAPALLRRAGAEVDVIHAEPTGTNINEGCGATHTASLQRRVVETGAELGLALDGDADRVLAVDGRGRMVDGDHLIAPSSASTAATSAATASMTEPAAPRTRTFLSTCGSWVIEASASSASVRPDRRTTSSSCKPVSSPSPVVAMSRKMTCPLCSPPRERLRSASASST